MNICELCPAACAVPNTVEPFLIRKCMDANTVATSLPQQAPGPQMRHMFATAVVQSFRMILLLMRMLDSNNKCNYISHVNVDPCCDTYSDSAAKPAVDTSYVPTCCLRLASPWLDAGAPQAKRSTYLGAVRCKRVCQIAYVCFAHFCAKKGVWFSHTAVL